MKFKKSTELNLNPKFNKFSEFNLTIAIINMNLELFWLEIMIFYHVYGNLFQSGLILKVH